MFLRRARGPPLTFFSVRCRSDCPAPAGAASALDSGRLKIAVPVGGTGRESFATGRCARCSASFRLGRAAPDVPSIDACQGRLNARALPPHAATTATRSEAEALGICRGRRTDKTGRDVLRAAAPPSRRSMAPHAFTSIRSAAPSIRRRPHRAASDRTLCASPHAAPPPRFRLDEPGFQTRRRLAAA